MQHNYKILLLLVTVVLSFSAQAINKCTDKKGKVSYQDKPCPLNQVTSIIETDGNRNSENTDNLIPINLQIPGIGEVTLFSYHWWDYTIIQSQPDLPPSVRMVAKKGEIPISFVISFTPNKQGTKASLKESADRVYQKSAKHITSSVEKQVNLSKLETAIGTALYTSFNKTKYQKEAVPKGEYSSITLGQAVHSKIEVAFTILTNGTDSKALKEAFNIISSFKIVLEQ